MEKYSLIPEEIFACQYRTGIDIDGVSISKGSEYVGHWQDKKIEAPSEPTPYVTTKNKLRIYLKDGDWVTKDIDGNYGVITNEIFIKKYRKNI